MLGSVQQCIISAGHAGAVSLMISVLKVTRLACCCCLSHSWGNPCVMRGPCIQFAGAATKEALQGHFMREWRLGC